MYRVLQSNWPCRTHGNDHLFFTSLSTAWAREKSCNDNDRGDQTWRAPQVQGAARAQSEGGPAAVRDTESAEAVDGVRTNLEWYRRDGKQAICREREVRNGGNKRGGRSVDYGEQVLMKACEALRHPPALPRKQNKQAVIL